jgi:hypothetical protein
MAVVAKVPDGEITSGDGGAGGAATTMGDALTLEVEEKDTRA